MLKSLKLVNYRSFSKLYLKFHPKKNIILANNAKGKSNVIESIYMLSFLKSFRTERNAELIKFGNASAYASFEYLYKDILNRVEITIEPKGKLVKQNDKMIKNAKEYNQRFEAVLFEPFDLNILKGAPGLRRKYIDSILTRLSPSYRDELLSYNKVLMNRNKALKMYKDKNSLKAVLKSYDTQLIVTLLLDDVFSELDKKRKKYLLDAVGDMQVIFTLQDMDDIKDLIDDDYLLIKLETNEMIYGGRNGR